MDSGLRKRAVAVVPVVPDSIADHLPVDHSILALPAVIAEEDNSPAVVDNPVVVDSPAVVGSQLEEGIGLEVMDNRLVGRLEEGRLSVLGENMLALCSSLMEPECIKEAYVVLQTYITRVHADGFVAFLVWGRLNVVMRRTG